MGERRTVEGAGIAVGATDGVWEGGGGWALDWDCGEGGCWCFTYGRFGSGSERREMRDEL